MFYRSAGKSQRTSRHDPLGSFNHGSMLPASRLVFRYHIEYMSHQTTLSRQFVMDKNAKKA